MNFKAHAIALLVAAGLTVASANAENAVPQVSVINLQVVQNADGTQSVITPKGDLARLLGAGVTGGVAQIFVGAQGGFWYTDKTGKTIDLYPSVQELSARRAQAQQAQQVPQYAPNPYPQDSQYYDEDDGGRKGAGIVSGVATAAAAGVGAAAGAALSNSYYRAPYGTPMYYGAHGHPYYYDHGDRREIEDLNQNQKAALYNKRQINKKEGNTRHERRSGEHGHEAGAHEFQRQQEYYHRERERNPEHFREHSGANPFAAAQFQGGGGRHASRGERGGAGRSRGGGGGRSRGGGRR